MRKLHAPWNSGQLSVRNDDRIWSTAIWAAFWLLVLTTGEPDLLGAIIALVERVG